MSIALSGLSASKGVAIGRLYAIDPGQLEIKEYTIEESQVELEITRLRRALKAAQKQLRKVKQHLPENTTAEIAEFIDTHLLMLKDSVLTKVPENLIRERHCNAEWALKLQRDELVAVFEEMDDPYLRTRMDDVDHVVMRIQRILLNQGIPDHESHDGLLKGCVVLARDLTPADTVLLRHQGIIGIITEYGSPTSHSSILARGLRIPAVVGMRQARAYLKDDDEVIMDGRAGVILVDPCKRTTNHYEQLQLKIQEHHRAREKLRGAPACTLDGRGIILQANIDLPSDVAAVKRVNAAGVGLLRSEFLYMNRDSMPDEDEQFEAYASVVEALEGAPLTIRTLDMGADKPIGYSTENGRCTNPALGLRAVRLCLREPALFRPQIRAILRASALGSVRLMIPMLSHLHELQQVLQMVEEGKRSLARDGIPFDQNLPVGAMMEVPAAAVCADQFARHVDFFSIGTNDLIQYTIAIDRVDDKVNYLYNPLHPAVLRLIQMVIQAGRKAHIPVGMCGEMAGNPRYVRLLLGMGLCEFSVPPNVLLEIKQAINSSDASSLETATERLLTLCDPHAQAAMLEAINSPE